MDALQPNELRPGRWRIGERDLQDGDLIEVFVDGRWRVARYEYQWSSHEYQLKVDGKPVAIAPGTQARKYPSTAT
jgi:hypothetical protein